LFESAFFERCGLISVSVWMLKYTQLKPKGSERRDTYTVGL
jgi:hypothetical protein